MEIMAAELLVFGIAFVIGWVVVSICYNIWEE